LTFKNRIIPIKWQNKKNQVVAFLFFLYLSTRKKIILKLNKGITSGLIILPIVIIIILYFATKKTTIDFLHNDSFVISEFVDKADGGKSLLKLEKGNDKLSLKFTLRDGYTYPYAGIVINKADYQKFSLNDYQLKLKVEASDDIRLSIRFTQFIDKYSKSEDYNTLPIFIKTIGLHKGENKIDVAAKNINEVPDWWIAKNPKAASLVNEVPLDNTVQMWIFCEKNSAVPLDKEFTLHISEFSLEGGTYWPYILAFLLIYGIIIFIYIKISAPKESAEDVKIVLTPIEKIETEDRLPKFQSEILNYIGSNYRNSNLKLLDVAQSIGLSKKTVSDILKECTGKNFRQYLNFIRMNEATRLLKESDLQIAEIADAVGYNNIQHFNRVFKEIYDISPKSFRN